MTHPTADHGPATSSAADPPAPEAFAGLPDHELIARYRLGIELFDRRLFEAGDEVIDRPFEPASGLGVMPCRLVLVHLYDAELVFQHRLRRVLAEDGPVFENFDHEAFLDSPLAGGGRGGEPDAVRQPVGALAAGIHTLRQIMTATLYQLPVDAWRRTGMHPDRGPVSFRALIELSAWHLAHHAAFVNAKLLAVLGPPAAPEACEHDAPPKGGCGAGCGCVGGAPETDG